MEEFSKKYLDILNGPLKGINLTRIQDKDEFYEKQILDSVLPLELSDVFMKSIEDSAAMVDVGFGGGFPLVPLAYKCPHRTMIGFEARAKKVKAVQQIAELLEINNVKAYHHRVEEVLIDTKVSLTFKAVADISDCLENLKYISDFSVFFYKGPKLFELENLASLNASWVQIESISYQLPSGDSRKFLGFRPKKVPRGTLKSNKELVRISTFI